MANISAASILYGTPLVFKTGDLLFSATRIEVASTATEYVEGGVEILETKLGFPDETISGGGPVAREGAVGATASTTGLPALVWTSGLLVIAKTDNEAQTEDKGAFPCQVTLVKGVPYLRAFACVKATQEAPFEEIKVKTSLSLYSTTIFALGK
jgi:hypothetical protein